MTTIARGHFPGIKIRCATPALNRKVQEILAESIGSRWGNTIEVGWNAEREFLMALKGPLGWFLTWATPSDFECAPLQEWTAEALIESYAQFKKDGICADKDPELIAQDKPAGKADQQQTEEVQSIAAPTQTDRTAALVKIGMAAVAVGWSDGDLATFVRDRLLAQAKGERAEGAGHRINGMPKPEEIVAACMRLTGQAQGTQGGRQFLHGANWAMSMLEEQAAYLSSADPGAMDAAWHRVTEAAERLATGGGNGVMLCDAIEGLADAVLQPMQTLTVRHLATVGLDDSGIEDLARSTLDEALQFGVERGVFERLARSVARKAAGKPPVITVARLASESGRKMLHIMQALKQAGYDVTANQPLALNQIGAALAALATTEQSAAA